MNDLEAKQLRASMLLWGRMFEILCKLHIAQVRPMKVDVHRFEPVSESELTRTVHKIAAEELMKEGLIQVLPVPQTDFSPGSNN